MSVWVLDVSADVYDFVSVVVTVLTFFFTASVLRKVSVPPRNSPELLLHALDNLHTKIPLFKHVCWPFHSPGGNKET